MRSLSLCTHQKHPVIFYQKLLPGAHIFGHKLHSFSVLKDVSHVFGCCRGVFKVLQLPGPDVIGDHGDVEKAYGILINRHPSLCRHNRHYLLITQCPHCQSSFCPPLKISFQSRFSTFDNISDVMISFSDSGGRHFTEMRHMRTYSASGVPQPRSDLILHVAGVMSRSLHGGETWKQGDLDLTLQNNSSVRSSTPVWKMVKLPHLVVW